MHAIKEALERLNSSINRLDDAAAQYDSAVPNKAHGNQPDMFDAPLKSPSNENKRAEITARLDNAIETVERILNEG